MSSDNRFSTHLEKYTCHCADSGVILPEDMEALSFSDAAQRWVERRWHELDEPEEVRVTVRLGDRVETHDVFAEVDVSFYTMRATDSDASRIG